MTAARQTERRGAEGRGCRNALPRRDDGQRSEVNRHKLDMRVGKLLRGGKSRYQINIDLYNVFNRRRS